MSISVLTGNFAFRKVSTFLIFQKLSKNILVPFASVSEVPELELSRTHLNTLGFAPVTFQMWVVIDFRTEPSRLGL